MNYLTSIRLELNQSIPFKIFQETLSQIIDSNSEYDLVCYGIGKIFHSKASQYQCALLLLLPQLIKTHGLFLYDPILSEEEIAFLKQKNITIIEQNEMGYRIVERKTLFYMIHCDMFMYDNVLKANMNHLANILILGNSFQAYLDHNTTNKLVEAFPTLMSLSKWRETAVLAEFEDYPEAFNNSSIHSF